MTAYPAHFQCPQITPYSIAVDMGLVRTVMDGGNARQRRLYRDMPHLFSLDFVMSVQELGEWQPWVNEHAYEYFVIDALESMYSGQKGKIAAPHMIRFLGGLAIDNPVYGWVRVKVQAELGSPASYPVPAWIIAGTPAIPSSGVDDPVRVFSFMAGALGAATLTRASVGWSFNSAGVLTSAAIDAARWTYDPTSLALLGLLNEPTQRNAVRNSTGVGAVPGSPGTSPTNWVVTGTSGTFNGVTRTLTAAGTEDGIPYVEYRYAGTPSASSVISISNEASNNIAAAAGQTWTVSAYARLIAGSLAGLTNFRLLAQEYNAAGASLGGGMQLVIAPTTAGLRTQRFTASAAFANALTAFTTSQIAFNYSSGVAIDITLRIGLPHLVQAAAPPTSPIVTTTAAVTRADDVLRVPLADGEYKLETRRASGLTTAFDQAVAGGLWRVPVDVSPVQTVTTTRTGPPVWIVAGTPPAPSAAAIEGGTPATWSL